MKFNVPEMSCGHCTSAIEKAIKAADGSAAVKCDLSDRTVAVESTMTADQIAEIMKTEGYDSTQAA